MLYRVFKNQTNGFYVDVGAAWPTFHSVTKSFYDLGWSGINIEPNINLFQELSRERTRDLNLNVAAGLQKTESLLFVIEGTGLSTLNSEISTLHESNGWKLTPTLVKVLSLREIFDKFLQPVQEIHFLKIDVEGFEREVILGNNWDKYRPWIVIIETKHPIRSDEIHKECEKILFESDYVFGYFDGLNRFYVAKERSDLLEDLSTPPNVLDEFVLAEVADLKSEFVSTKADLFDLEAKLRKISEELAERVEERDGVAKENDELGTQVAQLRELSALANQELAQERDLSALANQELAQERELSALANQELAQERELSALANQELAQERELHQSAAHSKSLIEIELRQIKNSFVFRKTEFLRRIYFKLRQRFRGKALKEFKLKKLKTVKYLVLKNIALKFSKLTKKYQILDLITRYLLSKSPKLRASVYTILTQTDQVPLDSFRELRPQVIESNLSSTFKDFFLRDSERIIFFYVEHTASFNRTTGVQRVAHKIAINLLAHQEKLVLIKLDKVTLSLAPLSLEELSNFARNANCLEFLDDLTYYEDSIFSKLLSSLKDRRAKSWLFVPEVTYHSTHSKQPTNRLIKLSKDFGLKIGFIYYDSIPFISNDAKSSAEEHSRYLSSLALADIIWPISDYSANHLKHYFLNVEKLDFEELPIISKIDLASDMETPRRISSESESRRIVLSVGTIDSRKNQISLIKAFNKYCDKYPDTDWQLYVVGLIREDYRETIEAESRWNHRIRFFYDATDIEVAHFYNICDFTVFPSVEEGFGLPITESLWNFKPCLCANFGVMAEVARTGGCVVVDTKDSDEISEVLEKLINEPLLREVKKSEIISRETTTWFEYTSALLGTINPLFFKRPGIGKIYYWVDATIGAPGNTGIQRVCRILARELIAVGAELVPIKWNSILQKVEIASVADLAYLANWNGPIAEEWSKDLTLSAITENDKYLMVDLPLNRDLEVQREVLKFFSNRGVTTAAIFYDAIPHKLSNLYPEAFSRAHREYMDILDSVDAVLTISEQSKKDLIDYINVSKNRGLGVEERIICVDLPTQFPGVPAKVEVTESVSDEICTILSVGTVEPRKNHLNLIEAFLTAEKSSARPLRLVIIGSDSSFDRTLPERIESLISKSKNIVWIKDADDIVLKQSYEGASFTVYPSFEEGFGLPIAESLWMGLPCICADFGQMKQLALKGGCLTVNVLSSENLSEAILLLANDQQQMLTLKKQIQKLEFRTWRNYAEDILMELKKGELINCGGYPTALNDISIQYPKAPILSIAISTYNRSSWLETNLAHLKKQVKGFEDQVEIIVCDNNSTDGTTSTLEKFQNKKSFKKYTNSANVGMLGNLSETTALTRGEYVWLIGDDDLIREGSIAKILAVINQHNPDLIYMNYSYSNSQTPPNLGEITTYHSNAIEMTKSLGDQFGKVLDTAHLNENFYTAIYTFVTKRKLAQKIYNQDTSGKPFSSLQTCVPTSKYILGNLLDKTGYWISEPTITINLNVSWGIYAPLWILERVPEVYDLAEFNGVPKEKVDFWRRHTLKMFPSMFSELFNSKESSESKDVDLRSIPRRIRHLKEFETPRIEMLEIYEDVHKSNHPLALIDPKELKVYFHE